MAGRLAGKVALISGGASGMGRATAVRFAAEGAAVVVADLNPERAATTLDGVRAAGGRGIFVQTDVSAEEDCQHAVAATLKEFGRVDILVGAAGIPHAAYVSHEGRSDPHPRAPLIEKPLADWERVLAVNLTGMMLLDRAVARRMIDRGEGGAIINIASTGGASPGVGLGGYYVSKAGVIMLGKVLALELAPHRIRVNTIGPGFVATSMNVHDRERTENLERRLRRVPMGRYGEPEEIANVALFLASDESSYITGELLFVDGGTFTG